MSNYSFNSVQWTGSFVMCALRLEAKRRKNCLSFVIHIRRIHICGELALHLSVDNAAKTKKNPLIDSFGGKD